MRLFVLIFLLPLAVFSQSNQLDDKGKKHGKWTGKYEDGAIRYRGQFEHGVPVGQFIFYYDTGEIQSKTEYLAEGEANVTFMHKNGLKKASGKYMNQKKDGPWMYFDERGHLSATEDFVNGLKEGEAKIYYDDKTVSEITNWVNGKREGQSIEYFKNGKKKSENTYENDELIGKSVVYYPNGAFKTYGKYEEGVKNGTWIYYHDDGKEHFRELYAKGKRSSSIPMNGSFQTYYDGDVEILKDDFKYKDGKKHGSFKEYHKKGEWKFERRVYDQDTEPGRAPDMVRTFVGQTLKREGKYVNGLLEGA
ncbi:MAG: toxin-antitoxin system YwqK family antitoxin, partial [Flavobacteriales bacterium]|nr:toxin-antitoxin system YwqK family antitoxin [Flavobacteriales bacterium]